ncbi:MAG: type III-B CRISPR-associated protein Cas10/Cmr2, partial [Thermoproteota archaeon]
MREDFFILKAACLLHDPPTKAWDLIGNKSHEKTAEDLAQRILSGTRLEEAKDHLKDNVVKGADRLSSGVDRWLLGELIGDDYGKLPWDKIKIKNIFNPKFSVSIKDEPGESQVDEFCNELRTLLTPISDIRLAYHALYACYEPYWILSDLPAGPADTRTPSHNVFDHSYATASMMNWLIEGEEPRGILLYIDLGGPQRFISSSRKLRDLWISSYLASALAWRLFWTFIRTLGPDVMVLPSCRSNPFYYHSLISELMRETIGENIVRPIKGLVKEIIKYDPDSDVIPKYATVPVTATLMLPDLDVLKKFDEFKPIGSLDKLKEFVETKYESIWKEVYSEVTKNCEKLNWKFGRLTTEAAALLERCKDYGFETPPLPIRVVATSIDELYKMGLPRNEKGWRRLYHYMFKLLSFYESKNKVYKFRPEENLKLYDFSINLASGAIRGYYEVSKRGFDYCSVCGRLPAIIAIPSEEELGKIGLGHKIESAFSPGERLCPYCLIKRLLSESEVLDPVMDKLLGKASTKKLSREFRSVSDIAVIPFKSSIIEIAGKLDQASDEDLKERFSRLMSDVLKSPQEILKIEMYTERPTFEKEEKLFRIIENIGHQSIRDYMKALLFLNSEKAILGSPELRRIWREFLSKLKELLNKLKREEGDEGARYYIDPEKISNICTYYAVVRSDADNFHKIIKGEVKDGFRIEVKDYLQNLLEGDAGEIVRAIIEKKFNNAKKLCENNGIKDAEDRI